MTGFVLSYLKNILRNRLSYSFYRKVKSSTLYIK